MNKCICLGIITSCLLSCKPSSSYSYSLLELGQNEFGYEINKDNQPIITQNFIPGKAGNMPFSKASDADRVASLVLHKLEKGQFPPTISVSEIDSLLTK